MKESKNAINKDWAKNYDANINYQRLKQNVKVKIKEHEVKFK